MFSDQYEIAVLRALRRREFGGWAAPIQLVEPTGLPDWTIRSSLRSLKRRRLVAPGGTGHWGEWSLTARGLEELARLEQLRVVR